MEYRFLIIFLFLNAHLVLSDDAAPYITQTVYGFLDFTTTIGNTVMVFSPQSAPALGIIPTNIIETKPLIQSAGETHIASSNNIKPTKLSVSVKLTTKQLPNKDKHEANHLIVKASTVDPVPNDSIKSQTEILKKDESTAQLENNLYEYDLLSRQPAEYAEETYRVINNNKTNKNRNTSQKNNGNGNSSSEDAGAANQSKDKTSQSQRRHSQSSGSSNASKNKKSNIRPTSSFRVLKTAAPRTSIAELSSSRQFNTKANHGRNDRVSESYSVVTPDSSSGYGSGSSSHKKSPRTKSKRKHKNSRGSSSTHKPDNSAIQTSSVEHNNRKSFRIKLKPTAVEPSDGSTGLYMFKLNRTPGRWQYKTTPKPRVTIRKVVENGANNALANVTAKSAIDPNIGSPAQNIIPEDLDSLGSQNGAVINNIDQHHHDIVETLNVEISTPANFKDTYYELVTIKTPYAFQVGGVKKSRFITVTSTIEKTLTPEPTTTLKAGEALTENILSPSPRDTHARDILRDTEAATLNPIHISGSEETPSLETITESFSISQRKLRTQILPIINDVKNTTSYMTLVHSYNIVSLITVTKTLSPLATDQFIPSKNFKDFGANLDEAGSEINLELEFGDSSNGEDTNYEKLYPEHANHELSDLSFGNKSLLHPPPSEKLDPWKLSNVSPLPTPFLPSLKQDNTLAFPSVVPPPSLNPFLLPLQQFQTITSSVVQQAIVTQTNSKVLKLTFGAKTAYTTLFSSEIVPTMVTMYITTSIPVQPTPQFPGYFPPAYPQFAYLG